MLRSTASRTISENFGTTASGNELLNFDPGDLFAFREVSLADAKGDGDNPLTLRRPWPSTYSPGVAPRGVGGRDDAPLRS
jgi:hypothetical protein